jgi:hypothetical protein
VICWRNIIAWLLPAVAILEKREYIDAFNVKCTARTDSEAGIPAVGGARQAFRITG